MGLITFLSDTVTFPTESLTFGGSDDYEADHPLTMVLVRGERTIVYWEDIYRSESHKENVAALPPVDTL